MRRILLALIFVSLALPASAGAGVNALIQDCLNNGKITGHYTQQQYAQALAHLPTDIAEYSDCAQVIRAAQLAAASGLPNPGSGSSVSPRVNPLLTAPPAEQAAVASAKHLGAKPLAIGGAVVTPGVVEAASLNTLPTPLMLVIGLLLAIAVAAFAYRVRNFVRARRSH